MSNQTKIRTIRSIAAVGVCAGTGLLSGGSALAQDAAAPAPEKKGWENVASVGATLTRGNSETFLATIGVNSSRKWSRDEMLLGASAAYGDNTTTDEDTGDEQHKVTDEYAKGFGQWNHLFTDRFYVGVRLDGLYDEIAGVDYRFTVSPLAGYYLIKNAKTFLAVEAGPSFIAENLRGEEADQYIALRAAERFEHKFSDRAKVWQTAEILPSVENFGDYVFNFEIGASAAITKAVDLRVVLQDTYRSEPPPHRKQNDLKLIAGIGYRF